MGFLIDKCPLTCALIELQTLISGGMSLSCILIHYLDVIETYGHDMATQRSMDIAINVLTEAETDTPCI